jgi:dihydropteroate synthase
MHWRCLQRVVDLTQPVIMGILNVTPDSFSDGGRYAGVDAAFDRAAVMAAEGAAIIDVGGESTRPGALGIAESVETERVVPIIERIARTLDVTISIDTSKPGVMAAATAAGAHIVNDVSTMSMRCGHRVPASGLPGREWACA